MGDYPPSVASRHLPPQGGKEVSGSSLDLPSGAGGRILQHNTLGEKLVANAIGFFEIFRFARRVAGGNGAVNVLRIGGRLSRDALLDRREAQQAEAAG